MKIQIAVLFTATMFANVTTGRAEEKLFNQVIHLVSPAKEAPKELQVKADDKIVTLGDSITAGGGYQRYVEQVLTANYSQLNALKITNAGVGGNKAENMIARFEKDVLAHKPTIVTINVGINDVWHRLKSPHDDAVLKTYRDNVATMADKAQTAGARVILLAPTVIQENPDAEGNQRLLLYVNALREIAVKKKCQFVDLHGMFLEALKRKPADQKGNWLTGDGVHMKPLGNAIMALGILRALGVPDEKSAATPITAPKK
jgi:lysophospholipase L1-like esterase